jgi:hypothetical protein
MPAAAPAPHFPMKWLDKMHFQWLECAVMMKPAAIFIILFTLAVIAFGTWQMFAGNLEAAFSSFPFLLIIYVFIRPFRRE